MSERDRDDDSGAAADRSRALARRIAVFGGAVIAPGVTVHAGAPRDASQSATALLAATLPAGTKLGPPLEERFTNDAGWEVLLVEQSARDAQPPLVAFVIELRVGEEAAFFVATITDDAETAARREAIRAFARMALPAWSGQCTLADLVWLPDDGDLPEWRGGE